MKPETAYKSSDESGARFASRARRWMVMLFLLLLPMANPWVRGDGVGYYAYARALLIQHNLDFTRDWQNANPAFRMPRLDDSGKPLPNQYSTTGHLDNNYTIGPAILWSPFLIAAHLGVLTIDRLGASVPADGFSRPYRVAMAIGTAFYGFLGLLLAFELARKYFDPRWTLVATLGIWFGSSLPVYMYFNPSWSHAHSAFAVALFLWYWHRTLGRRTAAEWIVLGLLGGLMVDVYYPNGIVMLVALFEALRDYGKSVLSPENRWREIGSLIGRHLLFLIALFVGLLPTMATRQAVFGGPFRVGAYERVPWHWFSPSLLQVLFSSDHGLISWTPIILLAVIGLLLIVPKTARFGIYLAGAFLAYWYLIASYGYWDGLSSYGNRFFISLTAIFLIGLAALLSHWAGRFKHKFAAQTAPAALVALLVLWNLGLVFQWGVHLIPVRGPVSFRAVAYNQVAVVPMELIRCIRLYFTDRTQLMMIIEQRDEEQLRQATQKAK